MPGMKDGLDGNLDSKYGLQNGKTLNWHLPYGPGRSPVLAANMVASSQPLAVNAGVDALNAGGTAVDAALATAITLTVVEPNNNGIGSDAFALVWDGKQLHGLNASGKSPARLDLGRFAGLGHMPFKGWDAVTVPGAVSAWVALHRQFGKLPFERLFDQAIHYARQGFAVGPKTGYFWQEAVKHFRDYPHFMQTFTINGRAPAIGESMRLPDHANTLEEIATTGGESFYRGQLAEQIAQAAKQAGAAMTLDDLAGHKPLWADPLAMHAFDMQLHEMPPNGQGLMALIALGIARHLGLEDLHPDSAESMHLQVEAMRIAWADVERHLADPGTMKVAPEALLADDYLAGRASEISASQANPAPLAYSLMGSPESDTVYLATADSAGMMVSFIQSNYLGFGSGIVIPGTGISMQNRGAGFVLEPGHVNQVGAGKRPFHTIIPGFVTARGQARMSFGVMGGHMQAQGHLQMFVRVGLHGQNPQAASDAPRWHLRTDGRLAIEAMPEATIKRLQDKGHDLVLGEPEHLFGGAQLICKLGDGYCGGSDHRKEGLAAGF